MTIADIQTEARDLVDADTISYPAALLLIRTNTAMEEIARILLEASGRWQWDDRNNVDYPNGVAVLSSLTNGTSAYAIDISLIKIDGVSIKDSAGNYYKLRQFDPEELKRVYGPYLDKTMFLSSTGKPIYYDLVGEYINLYPAPDNGVTVTLTNGLKVYGERTAQLFTSAEVSTGTKVPGFASPFHSLISYKAALPYAMKFKPERVQFIMAEIARKSADLSKFYSNRDVDERPIMTTMRPAPFK